MTVGSASETQPILQNCAEDTEEAALPVVDGAVGAAKGMDSQQAGDVVEYSESVIGDMLEARFEEMVEKEEEEEIRST